MPEDALAHVIEPAVSGRSRCRGCGRTIARNALRFGERLPNPYADEGEMTLWLHLKCAAYRRPEPFLQTLRSDPRVVDDRDSLAAIARFVIDHHRVARLGNLERAPSGRARCRACRKAIASDSWRIPLTFYQEGMFNPSGYIHLVCAADYCKTTDLLDAIRHFAGDLDAAELADAAAQLNAPRAPP